MLAQKLHCGPQRVKHGVWVTTRHGEAVVVGISDSGKYILYRYHSVRMSDGISMWAAADGTLESGSRYTVTYLREGDSVSAYVLTLTGDYGVDDHYESSEDDYAGDYDASEE